MLFDAHQEEEGESSRLDRLYVILKEKAEQSPSRMEQSRREDVAILEAPIVESREEDVVPYQGRLYGIAHVQIERDPGDTPIEVVVRDGGAAQAEGRDRFKGREVFIQKIVAHHKRVSEA